MTRYITGIAALILFAVLLYANQDDKTQSDLAMNNANTEKKITYDKSEEKETKKEVTKVMPKDHSEQEIDCKYCHMCEYPTVNDPCLSPCPREVAISVYHSPEEGPEIVTMDEVKGDYGPVMFSHKIHAQMSVMSGGCEACHHYNTTGPVLQCKNCHEPNRIRENIKVPDLEAAYHRQCIDCHRQWTGDIECNFCHIAKGQSVEEFREQKMEYYTGIDHPEVHEPVRVVYETEYKDAPIVTFFHDEHTHLFNIECSSCHHDENCMKCHDVKLKKMYSTDNEERRKKVHKTFEQHHQPCITCHEKDDCTKCHKTEPMTPFNHASTTGFDISKFHSKVKCGQCHKDGSFKGLKPNCLNCHNFEPGVFDHAVTGVKLDEMHSFLDCSSCHINNNFTASPKCSDCHEDKKFPAQVPGTRVKK